MGSVIDERFRHTRLWTAVLALALLVQSALLFGNLQKSAGHWTFAPVCASSSTLDDREKPTSPVSGTQHDACCILHCAIGHAAPPRDIVVVARTRTAEPVHVTISDLEIAPRASVKGAPQSPRPPPYQA